MRLDSRPAPYVEPPGPLTPESFAERLYAMLTPLADQDSVNAWSLLILINAIGTMYQELDDWIRDTPDGPGWSGLLDLGRCPPEALAWLGQFVGVRIPQGLDDAGQRTWIASTSGFKRGTRQAIIAAAQATLTGNQTVIMRERAGDATTEPIDYAYRLSVRTYTDQTPDPSATLRALLSQKPGGIVLDYAVTTGQTWQQVKDRYATWADVKANYLDWAGVKADEPAT